MDTLHPIRKMFRRLGLGLTVCSAALTGLFGLTMSHNALLALLVAAGLMCASVASAYVWPFVSEAIHGRRWISAGALAAFGLLVTTTDLTTNFGSIAWQRTTDIQTAAVQNTKYDDKRDMISEGRASLEMWQKRLAALQTEHAWTATVTATALRAEIPALDEAIAQESRRVRCGPKCLALKEKKADVERRIALAEEKADLTKKIESTKAVLANHRERAAETKKADSAALMQNLSLASMFTLSLQPTEAAQHWTDKGVAWLVAAFFSFGAMGCNFLGWSHKGRKEDDVPHNEARETFMATVKRLAADRGTSMPKAIAA